MTMSYKTKQTDTFTQFVKGDDNPEFADRLARLKQGIDIILSNHKMKFTHLQERNARIEYSVGKRYIKMIYMDDGFIVGSALVRAAEQGVDAARELSATLRAALD